MEHYSTFSFTTSDDEQLLVTNMVCTSCLMSCWMTEDLRESGECQSFVQWKPSAHCLSQNQNFVSTSQKLPKNRNWSFAVGCSLECCFVCLVPCFIFGFYDLLFLNLVAKSIDFVL